MQTAAPDRDHPQAPTDLPDPVGDDTGLHDVLALWRDLGGSD